MNADEHRFPMVANFIRVRWSETRRRIHGLAPGESLRLPRSQYFNAYASTVRLNDAYNGVRRWVLKCAGRRMTVTRLS